MSTWAWLFCFGGRLGRGRYWMALLVYLTVLVPIAAAAAIARQANNSALSALLLSIEAVLAVPVAISELAVSAKRFHDRGKTAWLLLLASVLNLIGEAVAGDFDNPNAIGLLILLGVTAWLLIDLGVMPGEAGQNAYGPDPRA